MEKDKLFYIGSFGETLSEQENEEVIKEAELFSTGTHRGTEYTVTDLEELAKNFNAEDEIPLQLDHSESARDTVGYLQEATVVGNKLMGKVKIVDEYAKERVAKGLMKKLSVSFYLKDKEGKRRPHRIREVSLVAFPQLKGAKLFSENGYVSNYEEEQGGKEMTFDIEKFKEEQKKLIEDQIKVQYSELQDEVKRLQEQNQKFAEGEITSKVAKFQEDNKVIPAQADSLGKLLASFSDEQAGLFEEFMSNAQKVDFEEKGEHTNPGEDKTDKRTQEQKDFDAFYEEHSKKYGTSL
jgi:hypothetical protein